MALIEFESRQQGTTVPQVFRTLRLLMDVARTRRALAGLDAHLRDDIGVSRAEAQAEAQKISWHVPSTWKT